ncbi:MAG: hypothetical protein V3R57_08815 [Candidatus Bathyarchaeia archaeon]
MYDSKKVKEVIGTMFEERIAFNEVINWGLIDAFRRLHRERSSRGGTTEEAAFGETKE